ncbi:MAG: STAS domain-containing protein [Actinomycetota bacterium]
MNAADPPVARESRRALTTTVRWTPVDDGVRLDGEVDASNASILAEIVALEGPRLGGHVRLELDGLSFMDGAGVRALLSIARELREDGGLLVLVSPGYIVRKALSVLTPEELLDSIRIVDS